MWYRADEEVMIVNANPYDTGFDENSHVMRFSAIAREVQTTAGNKMTTGGGLRRQISTQFSALKQAVRPMKIKVTVPVIPPPQVAGPSSRPEPRKPFAEHRDSAESYVMVEEELEVVEEDPEEESDEEDERDVMVDHLFEELREMKQRVS
jgi:kinesin family protein 20